jgi:uncharacterized protein CbrC (UPF0167 family)
VIRKADPSVEFAMGTVFRYIADGALVPCGGDQCHHCERTNIPIYCYRGSIVDPSLARNPELAAEEPDVSELCADCIRGGNVRKSDVSVEQVLPNVKAFASNRQQAIEEYHQLPNLPLFLQWDDWPLCCGEWCEFVGVPGNYDESRQVPSLHRYWEGGQREWRFGHELLPESLWEVSLFRCLGCGRTYFTWQFT